MILSLVFEIVCPEGIHYKRLRVDQTVEKYFLRVRAAEISQDTSRGQDYGQKTRMICQTHIVNIVI